MKCSEEFSYSTLYNIYAYAGLKRQLCAAILTRDRHGFTSKGRSRGVVSRSQTAFAGPLPSGYARLGVREVICGIHRVMSCMN